MSESLDDEDETAEESLHAVAAFDVVDGPDLVCVNSWGQKDMQIYLSKDEVHEAFAITVDITSVTQQGEEQDVPEVTRLYSYQEEKSNWEYQMLHQLEKAEVQVAELTALSLMPPQVQFRLSCLSTSLTEIKLSCEEVSPWRGLLPFLRRSGVNSEGLTFQGVLNAINEKTQVPDPSGRVPWYIRYDISPGDLQWLFPTDQGVPLMTLDLQRICRTDPQIRESFQTAFDSYCAILGFQVLRHPCLQIQMPQWPAAADHDMFLQTAYVTWKQDVCRILRSLKLMRMDAEAAWLLCVLENGQRLGAPWSEWLPQWRQQALVLSEN